MKTLNLSPMYDDALVSMTLTGVVTYPTPFAILTMFMRYFFHRYWGFAHYQTTCISWIFVRALFEITVHRKEARTWVQNSFVVCSGESWLINAESIVPQLFTDRKEWDSCLTPHQSGSMWDSWLHPASFLCRQFRQEPLGAFCNLRVVLVNFIVYCLSGLEYSQYSKLGATLQHFVTSSYFELYWWSIHIPWHLLCNAMHCCAGPYFKAIFCGVAMKLNLFHLDLWSFPLGCCK